MGDHTWHKEGTYYAKNREMLLEKANKRNLIMREAAAGRPRPAECEICARAGRVVWDHDHTSSRFRGWICNRCNLILGKSEDSIDLLHKLIAYIERSNSIE